MTAARLWVALLVLGAALPAQANPVDAFGFGARAGALGRAQVAAADDGSANYYNPALLATFDAIHIDLGYQLAVPSLRVNGLDMGVNTARGTTLALVAPGQVAGMRVALSGAALLPDQHLTRTRTLANQMPRFVLYDNRPQRLFIAATVAMQLGERLYAGVGLSYMSSTRGTAQLEGRLGFPDASDSDLALDIDVDLTTIRYPQAGILYRARPWLDVGVSYRGGFTLELDQVFVIQGDVGADGVEPIVEDGYFRLHTRSQDLFQPAQVTAGFAARITRDLMLAFDAEWQRWSAYQNPAARIALELDVGQFNELVDVPAQTPLPAPNFHDIVVPHLGVEWVAQRTPGRDLALRSGYVYEPTPVPEQVGETNFIDNDKHTISLGVGLTMRGLTEILPRPLSIDGFVALTVLQAREHRKLSPVDAIGDYRSTGSVVQAGLSSRWRF